MTFEQLSSYMNYLGLHTAINPLVYRLVHSLSPLCSDLSVRPASNSLYSLRSIAVDHMSSKMSLHMVKVTLRERGRIFLYAVNETATALCKRYPENLDRKQAVVYVCLWCVCNLQTLHQCLFRIISPQIVNMLFERCRDEVIQFDNARSNLSSLSLQDLHVPLDFICNVGTS